MSPGGCKAVPCKPAARASKRQMESEEGRFDVEGLAAREAERAVRLTIK